MQKYILLMLDDAGDLIKNPPTLKVPANLAESIFGQIPNSGGSIHGGDLRDKTFEFLMLPDGDSGVLQTNHGNYEIAAELTWELFERVQ